MTLPVNCAGCHHPMHDGTCGFWRDDATPCDCYAINVGHLTVQTTEVPSYCGHGNTGHCHFCEASRNFKALAAAIFGLIGLWLALMFVIGPLFLY